MTPTPTALVSVADPDLRAALESAIANVLATALIPEASGWKVVRLRTQKRLAELTAHGRDRIRGAIAVVHVTAANARHLPAFAAGLIAGGAAAVQLVWDGVEPPRSRVERGVFAALEAGRAAPKGPPVILARTGDPAPNLLVLLLTQSRR